MESEWKTVKKFLQGDTAAFIPDFADVLSEAELSKSDWEGEKVTIPTRLLKFLIQSQIVAQPFDEANYLSANPDVEEAVKAGKIESGWAHYVANGYFEGRFPGDFKIDETWYRRKYPDVGQAERRGQLKAREHYSRTGRKEGRAASATDEKFRALWKRALTRAAR